MGKPSLLNRPSCHVGKLIQAQINLRRSDFSHSHWVGLSRQASGGKTAQLSTKSHMKHVNGKHAQPGQLVNKSLCSTSTALLLYTQLKYGTLCLAQSSLSRHPGKGAQDQWQCVAPPNQVPHLCVLQCLQYQTTPRTAPQSEDASAQHPRPGRKDWLLNTGTKSTTQRMQLS